MTALVHESLAALLALARSLRMLLTRLARALDALVSSLAARQVPEWQMRQVQSEIDRQLGLIRAGALRQEKQTKCTPPANNNTRRQERASLFMERS
jgi:hypothetical protein